MLSVRKLSKVYKPKKGAEVTALDSVDLDLADSGLVFLLGKSGSGKSTLLNLLGGLDSYTSGDIIIKGKSSKDFKQSDFDSYRNTFIGFIFQEFNILEEYTVGKNIGLALELQHKKADKDAIMALLSEVDLAEYYDRKPNELSGGQKQRVAIARALIKHPEIIMADEPTGALDSKTGKQVFDTLKSLSKDKLIIVVSHDRENAEIYGDRIIELADGKIIHDRTRSESGQLVETPVNFLDTNIVHIQAGYTLTDDDAKKIKAMFQKSTTGVFISSNTNANTELNRILESKSGASGGTFNDTTADDVNLKQYNPDDFKLVKSRLPFKDSFKMGASGLKVKKVRLVFTILLSFIAFTLFGFSSTISAFNSDKTIYQTAKDHEHRVVNISSVGGTDGFGGTYFYIGDGVGITPENIAKIEEITGTKRLKTVFNLDQNYYNSGISLQSAIKSIPEQKDMYHRFDLKNLIEVEDEAYAIKNVGLEKATDNSTTPSNFNEIALTDFIADSFVKYGIKHHKLDPTTSTGYSEKATEEDASSYSDLIGKTIKLLVSDNGTTIFAKIVGVYKTDVDKEDYAKYKLKPEGYDMFGDMLIDGIKSLPISMSFVKSGFAKNHSIGTGKEINGGNEKPEEDVKPETDPEVIEGTKYNLRNYISLTLNDKETRAYSIYKYTNNLKTDYSIYYPNGEKSLGDEDIIVNVDVFNEQNYNSYSEERIIELYNQYAKGKKINLRMRNIIGEKTEEFNIAGIIYNTDDSFKQIPSLILNDKIFNEIKSFDGMPALKSINISSGNFGLAPKVKTDKWAGTTIQQAYSYNVGVSSQIHWADGVAKTTLASNEIVLNKESFKKQSDYNANIPIENETYIKRFDALTDKTASMGKVTRSYKDDVESYETINGKDVVIVGMSLDEQRRTFVSDELFSYIEEFSNMPKGMMISLSDKWSQNDKFFEYIKGTIVKTGNFTSKLKVDTTISPIIDFADEILGMLKEIFIYVALAFSLFAALMLMNFIGVSIANKKKDIGVLRAIGARSSDVFKIFLNEGLIIGAINFVLASIALAVVSVVLNGLIGISVLVPGILQYLLMAGVSLVVVVLATYIPVRKIASKKPIDAINNR